MILVDFNIPWNCQISTATKQLAHSLRLANLRQQIKEGTSRHGRILVLVTFREDSNVSRDVSVSYMLCDNYLINSGISLQTTTTVCFSYSYFSQKYRSINKDPFFADLGGSLLKYWLHQMILISWWISIIGH